MGDGEEQLTVTGIAQIEMVQHIGRQLPAAAINDLDVRAVEPGVHGDHDLAERQPHHGHVLVAGWRGQLDRGHLDHDAPRRRIDGDGGAGQQFEAGVLGARAERRDEGEGLQQGHAVVLE